GALLVLAPALGRAYNVYTALALAALVMAAVEPLVIYDAGFQLTTLATFGLPLLVPPIARRLALWLRWLPFSAAIAESLAVTIAAQLATLPVLALTFGQVSLVAPLANLLAVPLLAPLLMLGGLLALVGALLGAVGAALALALAWVVWPLLWYVDAVIALCAHLLAAALAVSNAPLLAAWVYYAALVAVVWWLIRRGRMAGAAASSGAVPAAVTAASAHGGHMRLTRGALAGLLALTLLGACGAAAPAVAMRDARLAFLDVGPGGEATLLRLPSGATALLNGGPDGPRLEAALAGQLPFWQRTLDVAVLSDPRPGDARGVEDAAAHFAIGRVADAGMTHPSADYLAYLDGTQRTGAARTQIRQGNVIHLDAQTSLRVLAPPAQLYPAGEGSTTASNDLILRLETPGLRALFLGAADAYALDALTGSGEPLVADVVELALPEGAPLDLDGPLGTVLRLAHPRLVVIASAPIPPRSAAAQRAATLYPWDTDADAATALGTLIYRVDAAGALVVSGGARGWAIG
ncbi:MAG TPA: ComEC/Rec2 family competence protein, partial [Ktedonobacterales bacterium]|nr:ComEC/Rec2 family competence protein [Ktedonobacterales bacterium]